MRLSLIVPGIAALATLAGCASTPISRPVEVLRYHADPVPRGTIVVQPAVGTEVETVLFRTFADAVAAELTAAGYSVVPTAAQPKYVATVMFRRGGRLAPDNGPRFSVGIGGGTFGRGGGIGGGVDVPVTGAKLREMVATEMSIKIAERSGTGVGVVWEGRGMTEADSRLPDAAPEAAARKVAKAMFRGFPGESGRTITVK